MPAACAFCGRVGKLTGEHVFGDWVSRIGIGLNPVPHGAGRLNRVGRELGVRRPFGQTVRDVCGECNHGWMSRLESIAQRVLTPLILGQPSTIDVADQGPIAAWVQKTALTAMLVSAEEERQNGYGLPASEYRALYYLRDDQNPLPASQFWVGRYQGTRLAAARVTPLVVHLDGLSDPDQPQGYAMTIALGQLVLQGLRFTAPSLQMQMDTRLALPQIWPAIEPVVWPDGLPLDDATYLGFAGGKGFRSSEERVELRPWLPATELARSRLVGGMVELPTACGKHVTFYPAALVHEAMRGRFSAFTASCACSTNYLIVTEPDGAHCKAADTAEAISELYQALPGYEDEISSEHGAFKRKRLTTLDPFPTRDVAPSNAS